MYSIIILIIIIFIILFIKSIYYYENFIAASNQHIFEDIDENNIISIANDPIIKYPNAYYFEWQNSQYLQNLLLTFKEDCNILNKIESIKIYQWNNNKTPQINEIYQTIYYNILDRLNKSKYMYLKNSENIQIVKDNLNRYSILNDFIIFDIDYLFYREGKMFAKHVHFIIAYETKTKNIIVSRCSIKGNVSSDNIYI